MAIKSIAMVLLGTNVVRRQTVNLNSGWLVLLILFYSVQILGCISTKE